MKVEMLLDRINKCIPFNWAEDWDNVGLLLGDPNALVGRRIAVALDPSLDAMKMAVERECTVLVTHHPLIFSPLKKIDSSKGLGGDIAFALRNGLSIICIHTNWDSSEPGVNTILASALELHSLSPLIRSEKGAWGLGAVGNRVSALTGAEWGQLILKSLALSRLEVYGDSALSFNCLALCGGSGGSMWHEALAKGAKAYFTADMKYHEKLEAHHSGLLLFIADHGEMEAFSLDVLAKILSAAAGPTASVIRLSPPKSVIIS